MSHHCTIHRRHTERSQYCEYLAIWISWPAPALLNGLAEMACQPAHSFSHWEPTGAMFYWHHPTSMQPLTPPSPLTSVWQNKIRSSRKWYQVRFEFLLKTSFEDIPQPSNLIWVQIGSTHSSLPQAIEWSRCTELAYLPGWTPLDPAGPEPYL